ncbi:MAG: sulfatase-like hydrolase/transferase [Gammaproteobacteria bacterium]|nr:sulfatase-like hydrolase/transferase [Gammaproteobacteria bacterium]
MSAQPNILLFFPDQHRGDWTGYHNTPGVRTPSLDGLAAMGQAFRNAMTPSPLCSPARGCLAAVAPYDAQAVKHNLHDVDPKDPNLYRALRNAGYQVLGCGKFDLLKASMNWGVNGRHGDGPDADLFRLGFTDGIDNAGKHDFVAGHKKGRSEPFQAFLGKHNLLDIHLEDYAGRTGKDRANYTNTAPTPLPDFAYCDNWIAANGLQLLEAASNDAPWFLQVNFNGPHEPMDVTASMQSRWLDPDLPSPVATSEYDAEQHNAIRANYAAMIENIDAHLGRYLGYLADQDILDDTVVIYASDHGEMLGDHDRWGKVVPHEPSVHIPLVLAGPGVEARPPRDARVDLVDLAATIIHLAGADSPSGKGQLLTDPALASRKTVGLGGWRAIYEDGLKYVHNFDPESWGRMWNGEFDPGDDAPAALYDLETDPRELTNLTDEQPETAARMHRALFDALETNDG